MSALVADTDSSSNSGVIYLIHFDVPFKHAKHYIGWTKSADTLAARLEHHKAGTGSALMRAVEAAGIAWRVVRTWTGDRNEERRLKNFKNTAARLCPVCKEKKP